MGVTNTGTFTIKKAPPLQVLYGPNKAYGACAYLERNALFTLLGHEALAVMQAIHVVCIIPSAKAHRQGQQACIVLLELRQVPTLFLCGAFSDLICNKLYSASEGHNMYKRCYVTRILLF